MTEEKVFADVGSQTQQPAGSQRLDMLVGGFSKYGTVISVILLFAIFSLVAPNFLTVNNLFNMLRRVAMLGIVTTGLTICVASGEFDLSVGSVMSLSGIITTGLIIFNHQPLFIALLAGVSSGIIFGLVNGILVSVLRVPSLITTLGMSAVAVGVNYGYSGGASVYGAMPAGFLQIGEGYVGPVPIPVLISVAIMGGGYILLERSKLGRHIVATGANPIAARLTGVSVKRNRFLGLVVSGFGAAVAGIVLSSYLGTGQPNGGDPYLLSALTAVFVGMSTIRPGQANLGGTVVGVLLLGILGNGLDIVGAPFFLQSIVEGGVLVIAVSIAASRQELRFF